MFRALAPDARRRRSWSAGTIAASIAAHLLVLGGAAYASLHAAPAEPRVYAEIIDIGPPPPPPPTLQPKAPTPPAPVDAPPPRAGQTVELRAPAAVPEGIPAPDLEERPLHDYETSGIGTLGDTYDAGATVQAPAAPAGGGAGDGPEMVAAEDLGEVPALANGDEVRRVLQRNYPPALRDAGVQGEAQLQFVIGTDGSVDPASVRVVSSTQEAFGRAAARVVGYFRFRPATMMGEPVRVLITIPIRFTMAPGT